MLKYNQKNIPEVGENFEIRTSKQSKISKKSTANSEYLKYLNIGFYLVTPLLVGVAVGIYVDGRFQTRPTGVIIGIIIGAIGTFYNLIKLII